MSGVRCQVSGVKVDKVVKLVRGGSVINGAYPVYFMKKDKQKLDNLAVIDNYNFYDRQTHKQTDMVTL